MKILVISESINIEDSSASKVNMALINNLTKAGFEVKVFHYSYKEIAVPSAESILINENKFSIWYVLSRIQRTIQRAFKINFNSKIETFLGFSFSHTSDSLSIANAIKKDSSFNPDFILTLSKGSSFRTHRALLKLKHLHHKWIAYIHDPYPFHYYPRPYNWVEKGFDKKEKFTLDMFSTAKYIAYPSQLLMEWMESYFESGKGKGIVIPHQIGEVSMAQEVPNYFDETKFNLLHAGNLLKQRNPEFLIKGFLKFLENNPNAKSVSKLILVGSNDYHKDLLDNYRNHSNIEIVGQTEYATVLLMENKASVNIILEAISEISPFLPGKFPNLVVANKPILLLSPYYSETKRLLGNDYQYWSEANDENKVAQLISELFSQWNNDKINLALNRHDLKDYCNEVYLKQTIDLLEK
ncbi:UDP-glycosyltransferase [Flavobacterium sp.]|uniref:UDP-glycosyltransferase n=1 Tax=Flavobacterium sp. TaxID=239 RepID=UPI0026016B0E|nr:UDP-glycosyltransferase [Flavobacterium sp.]